MYHAVKAIQLVAKTKRDELSIFWEFNVDCFTTHPMSLTKSAPARLLNAFIKALNEKDCKSLPRLVIFVPDWDLVKNINFYKSGAKRAFDAVLKWIMHNANRAIQSKKDSLAHKKPGSVTPSEPKIIWVKMIERIGGEYDKALSVRYRFNAALEDQLADHKHHYILDIGKNIADPNYLSARNQLNDDGMHRYWRELDRLIDLFEQDHDNFKPSQ